VRGLGLALAVGVLVAVALAVPGAFTIDESNYMASLRCARQGRLTLAETEGLPYSAALLPFDPTPLRGRKETPAGPTVPPLWPLLAWPFSWLGWRGLVLMNALGAAAAVAATYAVVARVAPEGPAPAWAAASVGLGGYLLEYASGLWPHGLTLGLGAAAFWLADPAGEDRRLSTACGAGLCLGLAMGVRYGAALFAGGLGVALLVVRRDVPRAAAMTLAALLPLAGNAACNRARLGSWHPLSKGPGYTRSHARAQGLGARVALGGRVLWARLVDFRARPDAEGGAASYLKRLPEVGAMGVTSLGRGAYKKAWLQSCPWLVLAFGAMLLAWGRPAPPGSPGSLARAAGACVGVPLLAFAWFGFHRHGGLTFNQRYLLTLLPVAAMALGAGLASWRPEPGRARRLALAGLVGALAGGLPPLAWDVASLARQRWEMLAPLALAAALLAAWATGGRARGLLLAAAIGWGGGLHLGEDVLGASLRRVLNRAVALELAASVPEGAAVLLYGRIREGMAPLFLEGDRLLLGAGMAEPAQERELIDALLSRGQRVLLARMHLPREQLEPLAEAYSLVEIPASAASGVDLELVELRRR
jgi:hypothetical protein